MFNEWPLGPDDGVSDRDRDGDSRRVQHDERFREYGNGQQCRPAGGKFCTGQAGDIGESGRKCPRSVKRTRERS